VSIPSAVTITAQSKMKTVAAVLATLALSCVFATEPLQEKSVPWRAINVHFEAEASTNGLQAALHSAAGMLHAEMEVIIRR